jgi:predicted metal-dependent hydrolase
MPPLLLVLVHSPALGDAIINHPGEFDVRWSLDFSRGPGPDAQFIVGQVADLQPALIVIEPEWPMSWLPRLHADPATRRIPLIAIVESDEGRKRAVDANANLIVTPDEFIKGLPDILLKNAKVPKNIDQIARECADSPSTLVVKGLEQFNAQEYFEAHETLETAWKTESGPVRELYRAILQVGVAYLQIQRGNYAGARKMFLRTKQWLAPLPDRCQGIDVAQLRRDALAVREHLESLGADRINEFDHSLLKPIIHEGRHH